MKIVKFIQIFPTEERCKEHFRNSREQEGIWCKRCGFNEHYWLKAKWQWQCKMCDFRTTLRSGTVMHNSKLPIRKWYIAMALMTFSKKPISAMELQRQLGHKYDTVWFLMHRIRKAMGQRDDLRTTRPIIDPIPKGEIFTDAEMDELRRLTALFWKNHPGLSSEFEIPKQRGTHKWYFRMEPKSQFANERKTEIGEKVITYSNKKSNHPRISDYIDTKVIRGCNIVLSQATRKWARIVVGNFSRNLIGIFHQVKRKYLKSYLDEFCYKLNRRDNGKRLFERLSMAIARSNW